jgi:hypothetical protein
MNRHGRSLRSLIVTFSCILLSETAVCRFGDLETTSQPMPPEMTIEQLLEAWDRILDNTLIHGYDPCKGRAMDMFYSNRWLDFIAEELLDKPRKVEKLYYLLTHQCFMADCWKEPERLSLADMIWEASQKRWIGNPDPNKDIEEKCWDSNVNHATVSNRCDYPNCWQVVSTIKPAP